MWDVRAPAAPLFASVHAHTDKALAVAWFGSADEKDDGGAGAVGVVSGGADRALRSSLTPGV
jgi:hypothetical protein